MLELTSGSMRPTAVLQIPGSFYPSRHVGVLVIGLVSESIEHRPVR